MSIKSGEQVLPTEGFEDFADDTAEEEQEYDDQVNAPQELNNDDTIALDSDEDEDEDEDGSNEDTTDEDESTNEAEAEDENTDDEANEDADDEASENAEDTTEDEESDSEAGDTTADEDTTVEPETDPRAEDEPEYTKKEKFERYSRSVQKRINKEVKQREQLRVENDELRQRLDSIEGKMTKEAEDSEAAVLANRLRNATSIKQKLLEDGEYEQVAQVDNDIIQMKIQQGKLEERVQQQSYQEPVQPEQDSESQGEVPEVPSLQTEWIKGNERWGKDKPYTDYVNSTYDALLEEGYDPETESMYEELSKRTGTKVTTAKAPVTPKAKAKVEPTPPKAKVEPTPAKPRPQSAPPPNTGQAQVKPNKKGLTEADKINMTNWGLDPKDVEARKEWLANKRKQKA